MVTIETAGVANPADTQGEKAASGGRTGAIETADVADPAEYGGGEAGFRAKTAGRAGAEVAHPANGLREGGIAGRQRRAKWRRRGKDGSERNRRCRPPN